jgi:hypothetical protein
MIKRAPCIRLLLTLTTAATAANLLSACAGTPDPNRRSLLSSELAVRQQYDRAFARYQNCVAENSARATACEWQRNLMEADRRLLASLDVAGQAKDK